MVMLLARGAPEADSAKTDTSTAMEDTRTIVWGLGVSAVWEAVMPGAGKG